MRFQPYKTLRRLLLATLLVAIAIPAAAQSGSASSSAAVTLADGIFLVTNQNLDFGSIVQPSVSGSVAVAPAGTVTSSNGVVHAGGAQAAEFTASTTLNATQSFWLTFPSTITLAGPATNTLTVRDFVASANVDTRCISYTGVRPTNSTKQICPSVKAGTSFTFQVGATVDVTANQARGSYAGSFAVTLNQF